MKTLRFILLILLLPAAVSAQGLTIGTGTTLSLGSSTFYLAGNWDNTGTFNAGNGTIAFTGPSGIQTITNAAGETFNNLTVNKASDDARLMTDITVNGTLTMTSGGLDLNGFTMTLGSSAIVDESPGSTVKGNAGDVAASAPLAAPNNMNIAGLGAVLSSGANLGNTTVKRGHFEKNGSGNSTILRYYEISPEINENLNATLVFKYDESELNGLPEEDLQLMRSTDGGQTWNVLGGIVDTVNNTVTLTGIAAFSQWTLGASDPPQIAGIEADPATYTEGTTPVKTTSTLTLTDPDDTNMEGATIAITGNYLKNQDILKFTNTAAITSSWDVQTGTLTLYGSASLSDYQAALRNVRYFNRSSSPSTEERTVSITVNDGTVNSNTLTRIITLTTIDAPTVTLLAPNGTETWEAGSSHYIQWTCYDQFMGILEYSMDGGTNWTLIDEDVDLRNGSYPWVVPDGASPDCLIRLTGRENTADICDSTFTIDGVCPIAVTGFDPVRSDTSDGFILQLGLDPNSDDLCQNIRVLSYLSTKDTTVVMEEWYGSSDIMGDGDIDSLSAAAPAIPVGRFDLPDATEEFTAGISAIIIDGSRYCTSCKETFSTVLAPPTNVAASWVHADDQYIVNLTWDLSTDDGKADEYRIYRSEAYVLKYAGTGKVTVTQSTQDTPVLVGTVGRGTTSFADTSGINPEAAYTYQVQAVSGIAESETAEIMLEPIGTAIDHSPQAFRVFDAYPNPFNPATTIMYSLPEDCRVTLAIYDIIGRRIAVLQDEHVGAGTHQVTWHATDDNGTPVSSGVYLYRLNAGSFNSTGKLMYMR